MRTCLDYQMGECVGGDSSIFGNEHLISNKDQAIILGFDFYVVKHHNGIALIYL